MVRSPGTPCPRAIGQSEMTREYIASLREGPHSMPLGPVFLQVRRPAGPPRRSTASIEKQLLLLTLL